MKTSGLAGGWTQLERLTSVERALAEATERLNAAALEKDQRRRRELLAALGGLVEDISKELQEVVR